MVLDAGSKVDASCTVDQLEPALEKGAVNAGVEMKDGVATLVTERRAPRQGSSSGSDGGSDSRETVVEGIDDGKGVDGAWFGNVSYLAPGTYTVSGMKGVEQQFLVAGGTKIAGYDGICDAVHAGPGGEGGAGCAEAELEAAARKGFSAKAGIGNGIATTITDDH
ncbi:hypothetical protein [Streptomyces sp. NPDC003522]